MIEVKLEQVIIITQNGEPLAVVKRDDKSKHQVYFKPAEFNAEDTKSFLEVIAKVSNDNEK